MTQPLVEALSVRRLEPYLAASGYNVERALALYAWNAQVAAALYVPLQSVEVTLRNRVAGALVRLFGRKWWESDVFLQLAGPVMLSEIEKACRLIRRHGKSIDADRVIATLPFGVWVRLLGEPFRHRFWARDPTATPGLRDRTHLLQMEAAAIRAVRLRNRVAHHQSILDIDLSAVHSDLLALLRQLSPAMEAFVRPASGVPRLMREKP